MELVCFNPLRAQTDLYHYEISDLSIDEVNQGSVVRVLQLTFITHIIQKQFNSSGHCVRNINLPPFR